MEERKHILNVLKDVISALNKQDSLKIKNLSNHLVHVSSTGQDPDIISLTVVIYSLSKIIERDEYKELKNWTKFYKSYVSSIEKSIKYLKQNDIESFRNEVNLIRENIQELSGNLKGYITDVFRKAEINKASRIYDHGISMEKTAKILGISIWELAEYAGQAKSGDINLAVTMPIRQRIKIAEEIFK